MTTRRQASGPAVMLSVTAGFVSTVLALLVWVVRVMVWLVRWWWRRLRREYVDLQRRRGLTQARRQFRLSRRVRRRIDRGRYDQPEPELLMMSLWWCLWMMSEDIPAIRVAEQMKVSKDHYWADAIGLVASQIASIPIRHSDEFNAAMWATEIRAHQHPTKPLPPPLSR